jgi:hypothetical protein
MLLLSDYGGTTSGQIDSIRKAFVEDRINESQYMLIENWKLNVDSGYILRQLLSRSSLEQYERMFNITKVIGGAFYGWAFEYLLHKKASNGEFKLKVQAYTNGQLDPNESWSIIEIPHGVATAKDKTKVESMASLSSLLMRAVELIGTLAIPSSRLSIV